MELCNNFGQKKMVFFMGYFTLFQGAPKIHGDTWGFWANKELVFLEPSTPLSSLGGDPNDQF